MEPELPGLNCRHRRGPVLERARRVAPFVLDPQLTETVTVREVGELEHGRSSDRDGREGGSRGDRQEVQVPPVGPVRVSGEAPGSEAAGLQRLVVVGDVEDPRGTTNRTRVKDLVLAIGPAASHALERRDLAHALPASPRALPARVPPSSCFAPPLPAWGPRPVRPGNPAWATSAFELRQAP